MTNFVCLALAAILLAGCNKTYTSDDSRPAVVFGDSIAYGTGTSNQRFNLASCLGRQTGIYFKNAGVPGETTRGAIGRLEQIVGLQPRLVVLSIGGNDLQLNLLSLARSSSLQQAFPAKETLDNMEHIFARFKQANIPVYYVNMNPPLLLNNPKSMAAAADGRLVKIQQLASRYPNVHVVTDAMDGLWLNSAKMADDIHPNNAGYADMCARIFASVKQSTRR